LPKNELDNSGVNNIKFVTGAVVKIFKSYNIFEGKARAIITAGNSY
jgi:hypothetical protein